MRFFAYAQNDTIGSFFVILRPKDLMFYCYLKEKEYKKRDPSPAANDDVDF
jgi:hypothetical protein